MKKNLKLFSVLAFLLLSTQAFAAKNDKSSVETKVASVDVHGNVNLAIKTKQFGAKGFSISDVVSVKVGDFKFTAPIVKDYSDVSNGEFLIRINKKFISEKFPARKKFTVSLIASIGLSSFAKNLSQIK